MLTILGRWGNPDNLTLYCRDEQGNKVVVEHVDLKSAQDQLKYLNEITPTQFEALPEQNSPLTDLINLFGKQIVDKIDDLPF